ncbi:hypothetical protein [Thalassobacillus devorans]|uniref:hypothetical protein n=1 Tax=Thalassobacillus devorans TaxID=279813 RepID=UPI000A1CD185|nr:hypothetical protein [Thalassobacillus devorans]
MEEKLKHLEFIQQAITRMATNSFLLKGWTVTLIVGVLAFANVKDMDSNFIVIALIPTITFWLLDAFYLRQERLFRELYDDVRINNKDKIDFSMSTKPYIKNVDKWFRVCISRTLWLFYLPIILVIILSAWILPIL